MRAPSLALPACTATVALAAFAAGCGSSLDTQAPSGASGSVSGGQSSSLVPEADVTRVLTSIYTVDALCEHQNPPPQDLAGATQTLLSVYHDAPRNILRYGSGAQAESMQTVVVKQAKRLRQCGDPQDAARLEHVAGSTQTERQ